MNEEFDFTGMSDIDYTDTFADIDQAAEDEAAFTAGLRKALLVSVRTIGGTDTWVKGTDHVLDPLFAGAVSGSAGDGWRVSLPAVTEGPEIGPASSFAPILGHAVPPVVWGDGNGMVMDVLLNLKAAPPAWLKSARWRLETGAGVAKYELFILPGKRDGSLAGSPEYVEGNVLAGMYWWTANFMGINIRPSARSACMSLAGAPKEVTGNVDCMMDPNKEYGPGFLNGAPLAVGGDLTVTFPPDWDQQRRAVGLL